MASVGINLAQQGVMPKVMEMDLKNTCTLVLDRLMRTNGIAAD
jgi:hypothetical protein